MDWKRIFRKGLAWLLACAIVAGNVFGSGQMTSFAAEREPTGIASASNADRQSSGEKEIVVRVSQEQVQKILVKDEEDRPRLDTGKIPYKGQVGEAVAQMLEEFLDGQVLITQKKSGKVMYLVAVEPDENGMAAGVKILGINGYDDRECLFRLVLEGDQLFAQQAFVTSYQIVEEEPQAILKARLGERVFLAAASSSDVAEIPSEEETLPMEEPILPEEGDVEIVMTGGETMLSSQERDQLSGRSHAGTASESNARSVSTSNAYEYWLSPDSIFCLNADVKGEVVPTPFEMAESYYGADADPEEKKETVKISLSVGKSGQVRAGESIPLSVTYTAQSSPLYTYQTGGELALFDSYENTMLYLTLPAGLLLRDFNGESQETEAGNEYSFPLGDLSPGSAGRLELNAYIGGNGELPAGEIWELSQLCLRYETDVKAADKSDLSEIWYQNIPTVTLGGAKGLTVWETVTGDSWQVEKSVIKNGSGQWKKVTVDGQDYVEIKYLIRVGFTDSRGLVTNDMGAYQTWGRTGFSEYSLTDTLSIATGELGELRPSFVSAGWYQGEGSLDYQVSPDNSVITIEEYRRQGFDGKGSIGVAATAPAYSSYEITARYPYEKFVLLYNSPLKDREDVFTVRNQADLTYRLLGAADSVHRDAAVDVRVREVNQEAILRIEKKIDDRSGAKPYGTILEKQYPGYAGFSIYRLENGTEVPYANYTVKGSQVTGGVIAVNPGDDLSDEPAVGYTTGDRGYVELAVDPGRYLIRENKLPQGTRAGTVVYGSGEENFVEITAGETKTISVTNCASGLGSIRFTKKAVKTADGKREEAPLRGAVFGLYDDRQLLVAKAESGAEGQVVFNPVAAGNYTVKELSCNGYVLDPAAYPVTVEEDKEAGLGVAGNTVYNTLNQGEITLVQYLLGDDGLDQKLPAAQEADYREHFFIQSSTEDGIWENVSLPDGRQYFSPLDGQLTLSLPVTDEGGRTVRYRAVGKLPDGYRDNNLGKNLAYQVNEGEELWICQDFVFQMADPQITLSFYNDKFGTLSLCKKEMILYSGELKEGMAGGVEFALFARQGDTYECVADKLKTPYSGDAKITVDRLDATREYYWGEQESEKYRDYRLEDSGGRLGEPVVEHGGKQYRLIGPFKAMRLTEESLENSTVYNIPNRIPYWLKKADSLSGNLIYGAKVSIYEVGQDGSEILVPGYENVDINSSAGLFVALKTGRTYRIYETKAPANYQVLSGPLEIETPGEPLTRSRLKEIYSTRENSITLYNNPHRKVSVAKRLINGHGNYSSPNYTFQVYERDQGQLVRRQDLSLVSNKQSYFPPGTYYLREDVPETVIDPALLWTEDNSFGNAVLLEDENGVKAVFYGPYTVELAKESGELQKLWLNEETEEPIRNYSNYGCVEVVKLAADKNFWAADAKLQGAVLGIYRADNFAAGNLETPILTAVTDKNGKAVFDGSQLVNGVYSLPVFDGEGKRISYTVAEISPPTGYLLSGQTLTFTLREGQKTVKSDDGSSLTIFDEPSVTLKTQTVWRDLWNNQFYRQEHVLGNMELALYRAERDGDGNPTDRALLVETKRTDAYDGTAVFTGIDRNFVYYVVQVHAPTRQETGLSFELAMEGDGEPLPLADGAPASELSLTDLKSGRYHAVEYSWDGKQPVKTIVTTDKLVNEKRWAQFLIEKVCDQSCQSGEPHKANGAKFALYRQKDGTVTDLNSLKASLEDDSQFQLMGTYESGTRVNPRTGARQDGQLDTDILDAGSVYWLVETKPAPGYLAKESEVAKIFVPHDGYLYPQEDRLYVYREGKNEAVQIKNSHDQGGLGQGTYRFQVMLNKWLTDESGRTVPFGGAKFQLWLVDPESQKPLLLVDTLQTGLENEEGTSSGYAMSGFHTLEELKAELLTGGMTKEEADRIIQVEDLKGRAKFMLKEIYAPGKVKLDPAPHYLDLEMEDEKDLLSQEYCYEEGVEGRQRLENTVSEFYPVSVQMVGYRPNEAVFGLTNGELEAMEELWTTPLSKVGLTLEQRVFEDATGTYRYVEYRDSKGKTLDLTTDETGEVIVAQGLPAGRYRLWENGVDEKYVSMYPGDGRLYLYFTVGGGQTAVKGYHPAKPSLDVGKTTWSGESGPWLEDITFTLAGGSGEQSARTVSAADGYTASFEDLEPGTYRLLRETLGETAGGWVTDRYFEPMTLEIGYRPAAKGEDVVLEKLGTDGGLRQQVTVKNPRTAKLTISKTDAEDPTKLLSGAKFTVEYKEFGPEVWDDNGYLKENISGLQPAKEDFEAYGILEESGGKGIYQLDHCPPGWYRITETVAPEGYTQATESLIVAVKGDLGGSYVDGSQPVVFENRKKVALTVYKNLNFYTLEPDLTQIPGEIQLEVYREENGTYTYIDTVKVSGTRTLDGTNTYQQSGTILLDQLPEGERYCLKEKVPDGWAEVALPAGSGLTRLDGGWLRIDAPMDRQTPVAVTVDNGSAYARILVTKTDEDSGKTLSGAEFALFADEGMTEQITPVKVGELENGVYEMIFSLKGRPAEQIYYVKETKAPTAYIINGQPSPAGPVEPGMTVNLTVADRSGVDIRLAKQQLTEGQIGPMADVVFELYRKAGENGWQYAGETATDQSGNLSFLGLELSPDTGYALSERPKISGDGFEDYRLTSLWQTGEDGSRIGAISLETEKVTDGDGQETDRVIYPLEGLERGETGSYLAQNQIAVPVTITKTDQNPQANPGQGITVAVRITDLGTGAQVGRDILIPYGENGHTVRLLPGSYQVEEVEILENELGYVIDRGDTRAKTSDRITVTGEETEIKCRLTNARSQTSLELEKETAQASIRDLWWNDGQELTYTLKPKVDSTLPLDGFSLKDQGLVMLGQDGQILPEADYTDESYTVTSVTVHPATQENHIVSAKGEGEASPEGIEATVSFFGFDGSLKSSLTVDVSSGERTVTPAPGANIKTVEVSYGDKGIRDTTDGYALGRNFKPGNVEVSLKLHQQSAETDNGFKEEIAWVENRATVTMAYRKWNELGQQSFAADTVQADASSRLPVLKSKAPVLTAGLTVDKESGVDLSSELEYTIVLENISGDTDTPAMTEPILVDCLPAGLSFVGSVDSSESLQLKTEADLSLGRVKRMTDPVTGRETLYIPMSGKLETGQKASVTFKAKITGSVIRYGNTMKNDLYVTSARVMRPFSDNPQGASFRTETSGTIEWPCNHIGPEIPLPNERYRENAYISRHVETTMQSFGGLKIWKEVKGNQDTSFVSGDTKGSVTKGDSGGQEVQYRLTAGNHTTSDTVTKLRLLDILPANSDYGMSGNKRNSKWGLSFSGIESVWIKNLADPGRNRQVTDYRIIYTDQDFGESKVRDHGESILLGESQFAGSSVNPGDATAFYLEFSGSGFSLEPGENLEIVYQAGIPQLTESQLESICYESAVNDFTAAYCYCSLQSQETTYPHILNSNPVQVVLEPAKVTVGGRVWIDDNGNGIQDESRGEDHLLKDLNFLLEPGVLEVTLTKYDSTGKNVKEQYSEMGGKMADTGIFLFRGLTPAKPFDMTNEDGWYRGNELDLSKMKGSERANYRLSVDRNTEVLPEGYEDLILELTAPTQLFDGAQNPKPGRSRMPETLMAGGVNEAESRDSNFVEANHGFQSERFFLWSSESIYDTTKDIGFIPYRNVVIHKTNAAGEPLEDAGFAVYGPYTQEELKAPSLTEERRIEPVNGTDGQITWKLLYYQNYVIVEEKAPDGYRLLGARASFGQEANSPRLKEVTGGEAAWILPSKSASTQEFPVSSDIYVTDDYQAGSLKFSKTDGSTGDYLPGARFEITKEQVKPETIWKLFGEQMKNPEHWASMGIEEVQFSDTALSFTASTGEVWITGLPLGSYVLRETSAPHGYDDFSAKAAQFSIAEDGGSAVLAGTEGNEITNIRSNYQLHLKKVDRVGGQRPLSGITFQLSGPGSYEEGSIWTLFQPGFKSDFPLPGISRKVTKEDGTAFWELPHGDYKLEEVNTPDGYEPVEASYIRVGGDGQIELLESDGHVELMDASQGQLNLVVENVIQTGSLTLEKRDGDTGEKLTGASFKLTGNAAVLGAFDAYLDQITGLGVQVISTEKSAAGKPAWIEFRLIGTEEAEEGFLANLPFGEYTLQETEAPDGYQLDGRVRSFTMNSGQESIKLTGENAIKNIPSKLVITKKDARMDHRNLPGAQFLLRYEDGSYVKLSEGRFAGFTGEENAAGFVTGEDGTATILGLVAGEYTLIETKAPEGYALSPKQLKVPVDGHSDQAVTVTNEKNVAKVVLYKVSLSDRIRLKDAVFGIYRAETCLEEEKVDEIVTDVTGRAVSKDLPVGTYYVKETKAPAGYTLRDTVYPITLVTGEDEYVVTSVINGETVPYLVNSRESSREESGDGERDGGNETVLNEEPVNILPDPIPLSSLPTEPWTNQTMVIDDGQVPLANLPKTGDKGNQANLAGVMSGLLLGLYAALKSRKEKDS